MGCVLHYFGRCTNDPDTHTPLFEACLWQPWHWFSILYINFCYAFLLWAVYNQTSVEPFLASKKQDPVTFYPCDHSVSTPFTIFQGVISAEIMISELVRWKAKRNN
jgi:hypothetical protein